MTKQYVCGATSDAPVNGQMIFTAEFLKNCFVNFIIVNNVNETQLGSVPSVTHSYVTGTIKRTNPWITGDELVVDYTPCKCK